MPQFVFIESNTSGTGALAIEKARSRGYDVLFLTARPDLYRFLSEKMISPVRIDTSDVALIEQSLFKERGIAGVWSTSEYFAGIAAQVSQTLQLPGSDPAAIGICRDKSSLYSHLHRAGALCPATRVVTTTKELTETAGEIEYPVVIKPAEGSGSVGVRFIDTATELLEYGAHILSSRYNERGIPRNGKLLIQEFVPGDEYSVEVVCMRDHMEVLGVTRKHLGRRPFFIERGHDFPANLEKKEREAIVEAATSALQAVGYRFGPAHVECKLYNGSVTIIEINPRLAGGLIPSLIERSMGVDVLGAMVDLFAGKPSDLTPVHSRYSAIRFVIADRPGFLRQLAFDGTSEDDSIHMEFGAIRNIGDEVVLWGDYRDRLGYLIADADTRSALQSIESATEEVDLIIDAAKPSGNGSGRLINILATEALAIVRKPSSPESRLKELVHLAAIDRAHLIMFVRASIYPAEKVKPILAEIERQQELGFTSIIERIAPRGLYSLYEDLLLSRLGVGVAGIVHTARSRNDINACLIQLEMREYFSSAYRSLWRLRSTLLEKASVSHEYNLPVFSQYQPGQPGSLGYYLWSVEKALSRDQASMCDLLASLDTCPLGACAGAGTDFPILPNVTAELLGFSRSFESALDAVASRDFPLRLTASLAISSTTLSRLAQDFQLWTMADTGFISLPDDLCGASSIMPQKRNPYLLELVKGKLINVASVSNFAIFSLQRTPFSNSVEVGTEGQAHCKAAVTSFVEACDLLRLIVDGATANADAMTRSANNGLVAATQIANELVRQRGLCFHEAHREIGSKIIEAVANLQTVTDSLGELTGKSFADVARLKDDLKYGHGPGSLLTNWPNSVAALRRDSLVLPKLLRQWESASRELQAVTRALIAH